MRLIPPYYATSDLFLVKKTTEQFLIDAESATEAEVKIYKEYEGWNGEFEIMGVNKSRIIKILV